MYAIIRGKRKVGHFGDLDNGTHSVTVNQVLNFEVMTSSYPHWFRVQ